MPSRTHVAVMLIVAAVMVAGCGSNTAATASAGPTAAAPASSAEGGDITLDAPDEVAAGSVVSIAWAGPVVTGDYVTIAPKGATSGNDAPYVNITVGSPGELTAPTTPGEYEILLIKGDTLDVIKARRPLAVK
jgi:hypothetical protein